jgi:hypothetical protein
MAKSDTLSETRQKFEKWAFKQYSYMPEQVGPKHYSDDAIYAAWIAWQAGRLQGLEEARELIEISRAIVCKVRLSVGDELRVKLLEKMDFWLMEHDEAIREKADG